MSVGETMWTKWAYHLKTYMQLLILYCWSIIDENVSWHFIALSLKINVHNYICKMGYLIFVSDPGVTFVLFKKCTWLSSVRWNLYLRLIWILHCKGVSKGHSRVGSLDFFFLTTATQFQLCDVLLRILWMIFKLIFLQWVVFPWDCISVT